VTKKEIHDETKHEIELEAEAELEEAGGAQPDDSAVEAEPSTADETPEEAIERLKAESDEYLDGWQRSRAEFANYKKRVDKEREEARQRIAGEIITRYLGILDDLERALADPPTEDERDEWTAGVHLIYSKFKMLLESEGVETIEPENVPFDPNYHEAVTFEDSEDIKDGFVIDFTQRGYTLGDRVLRPAMVRVAK
jgi:molecular chaperone GrpE